MGGGIKAPARATHLLERHDLGRDAVQPRQPVHEAARKIAALEVATFGQGFGRPLDLGKIIGMRLEEVARFLGRQHDALFASARQIDLQRLRILARHAPGAIKIDHGPCRIGRRGHQPLHLVGIDLGGVQRAVSEDLAQRRRQASLRIIRQLLQVDVENLAQPQEQRHRNRPLVMLDEVEIARADAETLGHLLLSQPSLAPQAA